MEIKGIDISKYIYIVLGCFAGYGMSRVIFENDWELIISIIAVVILADILASRLEKWKIEVK